MTKTADKNSPATDVGDYFYLFVINPTAGRKRKIDLHTVIQTTFAKHARNSQFEIVVTEYKEHAVELARNFAREYGATGIVVACGGDGTVNEVANALYGYETALAVLPLGTGNDFTKTAYPRKKFQEVLEGLLTPSIRKIDVILIADKISLNITSLGFDSKVQKNAEYIHKSLNRLGDFAYPLAIIKSIFGKKKYYMRYRLETCDKKEISSALEGDIAYILAAICNGRYYGNGFNPAPQADLEDGVLDICFVNSMNLLSILLLISRYKKGTHLEHAKINYYRVCKGEFSALPGEVLEGNIDGEIFYEPKITFEVRAKALNFAFLGD